MAFAATKFAIVFAPLYVHQIAPCTVFGTGFAKATVSVPVQLEFDVVGGPTSPKRIFVAMVDPNRFRDPNYVDLCDLADLAWLQLRSLGNGRYGIFWTPDLPGPFVPLVIAWIDEVDRLIELATRKLAIGDSVELELGDIEMVIQQQISDSELIRWPTFGLGGDHVGLEPDQIAELRVKTATDLSKVISDPATDPRIRLVQLSADTTCDLIHLPSRKELRLIILGNLIRVERKLAGSSNWYELFPRSFGGFRGVIPHLKRIAELGFNVLYLPPIHPIGKTNRKGKNNSLLAEATDVGSPWAIGSSAGGHTAIEPTLGSLEDFRNLSSSAVSLGIQIAIDIALQCSPDHPWVSEHPNWFSVRSDSSIAFAENPPKKYQDIYPINFYAGDQESAVQLWEAIYGVFLYWIDNGVSIFRVDNPHTKPLDFWEWICERLRREHPEVVLLAEAFTVPNLLYRLGEIGFSQSYTYFTWRRTKAELVEYGNELAGQALSCTIRPNFWPNTPDILSEPLRYGSKASFMIRATLAATMASSWGIYSGFEFCENQPLSPASEEYLDSEKYQIRHRDFATPAPLDRYLAVLNSLRRDHRSLAFQPGFVELPCDNLDLLAFLRFMPDGADAVVVVVNLCPDGVREGLVDLWPLRQRLGLSGAIKVVDRVSSEAYTWSESSAYVRLDPKYNVAHLLEFDSDDC